MVRLGGDRFSSLARSLRLTLRHSWHNTPIARGWNMAVIEKLRLSIKNVRHKASANSILGAGLHRQNAGEQGESYPQSICRARSRRSPPQRTSSRPGVTNDVDPIIAASLPLSPVLPFMQAPSKYPPA